MAPSQRSSAIQAGATSRLARRVALPSSPGSAPDAPLAGLQASAWPGDGPNEGTHLPFHVSPNAAMSAMTAAQPGSPLAGAQGMPSPFHAASSGSPQLGMSSRLSLSQAAALPAGIAPATLPWQASLQMATLPAVNDLPVLDVPRSMPRPLDLSDPGSKAV